jgi:hypothetical protein
MSNLLLLAVALSAPAVQASDWIGAYAVIDKVVFEPRADAPQRIQIWGAFTVADPRMANRPLDLVDWNGQGYQAPQRGYLYFTLPPTRQPAALSDWAAISAIAGKREAIGFGLRYIGREYHSMRLRQADEAPKDPDVYLSAEGDLPAWNPDNLQAVRTGVIRQAYHGADYVPVKRLLEFARRP